MFTTEMWGNTLAVLSSVRTNADDEPQLLGKSSVSKNVLSNGHCLINAAIEIRPYCEPGEIVEVQAMLLTHMLKELDK